jgi:HEAT repeat protein
MKDSRAVEDLIRLLQADKSFQVRYTAARALAKIGDERAVGPLMAAMADPDTAVRNVAVDSLGAMNATQAISGIEAFSKKYEYPSAQYSAEQALRLLRGSLNDTTKSTAPPALQR